MSKAEIIKRPIEQISGDIKKSAWSAVFESLSLMILGSLFVAWPNLMMRIVTYIFGTFFIVKGAFQIINYFVEKGQNDFFNNNLLSGVISVLIGITILVIGSDIVNVFRIIVGIFIIYESLVRMNTALKLHTAGLSIWRITTVLALIMLVLGVFVTFNDVATVIGWMMIVSGLVGIVGDIMFIQKVEAVVEKLTKNK